MSRTTEIERPVYRRPLRRMAWIFSFFVLTYATGWTVELVLLQRANDWVDHTLEVKQALLVLLSTLQDAETGQRGYVITGNETYLEPYRAALEVIDARLELVASLTIDNPRQQQAIAQVRTLAGEKLAELAETVELRRLGNPDGATQIVHTDFGLRKMEQMRHLLAEMQSEEDRLLRARRRRSAQLEALRAGLELASVLILSTLGLLAGRSILKATRERELLVRQLAASNRELEEFAYRVSHDLRSPLGSAAKLVEVSGNSLRQGNLERATRSIELSRNSLQRLDALIEDILRLGKASHTQEAPQPIDLEALLIEIFERSEHLGEGAKIETRLDLELAGRVLLQPTRSRLTLENLVHNAVKYRDPTEATPFVSVTGHHSSGVLTLSIEDNGLRIPERHHDEVFGMFKRFHVDQAPGSGLGLFLVAKSARLMGGEVTYEDTGQGSRFTLRIPAEIPSEPTS